MLHAELPQMAAHARLAPQDYDHGPAEQARISARSGSEGTGPIGPIRLVLDFTYFGSSDDVDRTCLNEGDSVKIGDPSSTSDVCSDTVNTNCWLACDAESVFTTAKGEHLQNKLLPQAKAWLEGALSVVPCAGNLKLTGSTVCGYNGGITIPPSYTSPGVPADMVLFVTARPTLGNVIAYAGSCKEDQFGRPVAGHMNFGPNKVDLASEMYSMQLGVAIHEITHALGFQSSKYGTFKDGLNSTNALPGPITETDDGITYLKTPKVVATAQDYFNCPSITRIPVEDAGGAGTAGSHWEKRLFLDEFMTGSSSIKPVLSVFTLAILEDSGWYLPDYSKADRLDWGRNMGCSFVNDDCGLWKDSGAFGYNCGLDTKSNNQCTYDRKAKGYCQIDDYSPATLAPAYQHFPGMPSLGGFSDLADFCPITRPYSNGLCSQSSTATSNSFNYGENFHDESRCFDSSLTVGDDFGPLRQNCHRTLCFNATGPLRVQIGLTWVVCPSSGKLTAPGYEGSLDCPDVSFFCAGTPSTSIAFPTPTNVEPKSVGEGDVVTVTGEGFFAGMDVYLGLHKCTDVTLVDAATLTCVVAAHPEYSEEVDVPVNTYNADGQGSYYYPVTFRGSSNSLLSKASDAFNSASNFAAENWFWICLVLIFLVLGCAFYKICIKSGSKSAKVAPAPPPHHRPSQPHHAPQHGRGGGHPHHPYGR
ncbi:uncharacterized protein AMSG_02502 [Thecamonas trahens ATCC 50062]|uniref:IPT/TIG domain-containing protein n=1 Tax=Thecamonas trahens ATCC 50062 TaxID=461836 RepID=A0A0L0D5J4_THETB|nr:hypothetical protein AMSG_02502 [Thecamonas trahens ATCC 50062]KNC47485.1 hypothetical protein AMSG_02502 [Thecamonas trahens ATCC 50062]|eukprot:XP_013759421.1 hypothetical protein AMSG_02502 [Thecamonas trahens ATCC 50062]